MKRAREEHQKLDDVLSPLEQDILAVLWESEHLRVKEIHAILRRKSIKVAVSSVAVTLDRLHERDIVSREGERSRGGVRYIYTAKGGRHDFEKNVVESAVNKLIEQFGSTAVSYFNERFRK